MPTTTRTDVGTVRRLAESFEISLHARNLSPRTIRVYREAVRLFARYLDEAGMPATVAAITREHVESFLARELERVAATSVHIGTGRCSSSGSSSSRRARSRSRPW